MHSRRSTILRKRALHGRLQVNWNEFIIRLQNEIKDGHGITRSYWPIGSLFARLKKQKQKNYSPGAAGDWTPDFSHAKRTLYLWVTTPDFTVTGYQKCLSTFAINLKCWLDDYFLMWIDMMPKSVYFLPVYLFWNWINHRFYWLQRNHRPNRDPSGHQL